MSGQTPRSKRPTFTGLLLFSGLDKSGIAAGIFAALSPFSIKVVDVEQILIGERTLLTILIELDAAHAESIETDLTEIARTLEMDFAAAFGEEPKQRSMQSPAKIVIVGNSIAPKALHDIAAAITAAGGNINRIVRIAANPILAMEFFISVDSAELDNLRSKLKNVGKDNATGISLITDSAGTGLRKLVIFDVDSTLIQEEVIDLLAVRANVGDQVSAITARAMRGEIDFAESLTARVSLLAGLSAEELIDVKTDIHLSAGAKNLINFLQKQGHIVAAVSGGFTDVLQPIMNELGIANYRANKLEIVAGKLTGKILGEIVDARAKSEILLKFAQEFNFQIAQTVAIGDGANDLIMLETAGIGIAFNAKPKLKEVADIILDIPNLDGVIYLLGMSALDVTSN